MSNVGGPSTNGGGNGALGGPKTNGGGNGGNGGKPTGNINGMPVNQQPKPKLPSIPNIPDHNGGAAPVEPVDLSLLAGPQDLPKRRPLINASVAVPQTGVTGYAGVFIP